MIIPALAYERSNLKQMGKHACMRCRKQQSKYEEISQSIARTTCAGSGRIAPNPSSMPLRRLLPGPAHGPDTLDYSFGIKINLKK